MSKISDFVKQPRSYREVYEMTDELLGYTGLHNSHPKVDGEKWWEVFEYLDFHANGTKPAPYAPTKHKESKDE